MKINSKMIAFSDNGERGEKIVDVPLAGPTDRKRGCFFPPDSIFSRETVEIGSVFTISVVLSSFSCHLSALCLFLNAGPSVSEHYMVLEVERGGLNPVITLCCFCGRFSCFTRLISLFFAVPSVPFSGACVT